MRKSVKLRITALLLSTLLLSSCNKNPQSSSVQNYTQPASTTEAVTTAHTTTTPSETTTAKPVTESSASVTTVTTTVSETSDTTTVSSETTQETTTIEQSTTTAVSETTSETTTSVATKTQMMSETSVPAADVPPAQIRITPVSSPGVLTEITEAAMIDYSNASCGYISASYSGASKKAKLRIVSGDITCDHDLSVTGKTEYFPLMQGSGDYRIQIYEQLDGKLYSSALDLSVSISIDDDVAMYLYTNRYSVFDENSDCVKKSAEVCGGAKDDIEKIAAIFKFITDNITYDYDLAASVQSGYLPDPDSLLAKKKGICFDYASLFAAMCRSQGIPTRLVIGYADPDIYHAWNEVYTTETGWITPELLLGSKGYNLVDATFYAGADDKKYIAEYISDKGNYSAVYRY